MLAVRIYKIISWLCYKLPAGLTYGLAAFGGELYYWAARNHSRWADENMRIVLGEPKINRKVRQVARRSFRNYCKSMVDFLRQPLMKPGELEEMCSQVGWHYLTETLNSGKGIMLISPHFGNWDGAAVVVTAQSPAPLSTVAKDFEPPELNELIQGTRRKKGITVYSPEGALRGLFSALKKGELVVLMIDSPVQGEGVVVDFFGKPARFASGPATIASKTGSPIMLGYIVRQPGNRYFYGAWEPPLTYKLTGNREQDILTITQACASAMEKLIARHPDQWYMFRKLWLDESELAEYRRSQEQGKPKRKVREQKSGVRSQESEAKEQKSGVRSQGSEVFGS